MKLAFLLIWFGVNALAADIRPGVLYEMEYPSGEWRLPQVIETDHIYIRYRPVDDRWTWVTGENWRRILPGSKVKGWQLGVTSVNRDRWFRLSESNPLNWDLAWDKERACIYRETGPTECEQEKKEDPPPTPLPTPVAKPTCTLMATPTKVTVGNALLLEIILDGQVTEAGVDDQKLDLKVLKRIHTPRVPGKQTVLGWVKGPAGESTCWAQFEVTP